MSVILALRGLRQEDCCKFKTNLGEIAIPCVKKKKKQHNDRRGMKGGSEIMNTHYTLEDLSSIPSKSGDLKLQLPGLQYSLLDSMGTCTHVYNHTQIPNHICSFVLFKENSDLCLLWRVGKISLGPIPTLPPASLAHPITPVVPLPPHALRFGWSVGREPCLHGFIVQLLG